MTAGRCRFIPGNKCSALVGRPRGAPSHRGTGRGPGQRTKLHFDGTAQRPQLIALRAVELGWSLQRCLEGSKGSILGNPTWTRHQMQGFSGEGALISREATTCIQRQSQRRDSARGEETAAPQAPEAVGFGPEGLEQRMQPLPHQGGSPSQNFV